MSDPAQIANGFRFGPFSLDRESGDLYKNGRRLKRLRRQDHKVLVKLVDREPEVVSREELIAEVWGEQGSEPGGGLTGIVRELREALAPEGRTYIENIPARGYRFTEPVAPIRHASELGAAVQTSVEPNVTAEEPAAGTQPIDERVAGGVPPATLGEKTRRPKWLVWVMMAAIVLLGGAAVYIFWPTPSPTTTAEPPPVAAVSEITIKSPAERDKVNHRAWVTGSVRPPGAGICVVINPDGHEGFHTQPNVEANPDGSWRVYATFGIPGREDVGKSFHVRAIAGCNAQSPDVLAGWPAGVGSDIVTVTRQ
jgi:DNA-binding winged helix-turn-helix (wHTH) protein